MRHIGEVLSSIDLKGNVLEWTSVYKKIFETNDPNVTTCFDTSAHRGFDNYYYIQTKDDGTQIPGKTLYSSLFWTLTNTGAVRQIAQDWKLNSETR